jgi:bifunctional non-homologous end joining protein LigD
MSLRERTRPGLGIIAPCLPSPAKAPLSGPGWLHEIKHDGFCILARRDSAGVRLITRNGNDFTHRFPFISMAVGKLPVRPCLIDGEAIVCDENGLALFELIRRHGALASAVHCAFDLLELDGKDLRRQPIEIRKHLVAKLLKGPHLSIVLNEHFEEDGASVYRAACQLGCEGIVSKRLGSPYRSGRSPYWVKVKNLNSSAVKREAEEIGGDDGRTLFVVIWLRLSNRNGLYPRRRRAPLVFRYGVGLARQPRSLPRFCQRRAWLCAFDRWHDLDQL